MINRRKFLTTTSIATLAAVNIPNIVSAAFREVKSKPIQLKEGDVILFQGDSITDGGRDRKPPKYNFENADRQISYNDFNSLGAGYVMVAGSEILFKNHHKKLKVFNRGISGDKVYQLADRWDEDCLNLKPTIVSILVGVNDHWHSLALGYKGTTETYKTDYRKLVERTKQVLPDAQIIIGEPFALKGVQAVTAQWYPTFDQYREIAREISTEYKTAFIPYQTVFDKALEIAPASYWTFDGVHPSVPGCKLVADAWLKTIKY